MLFGRAQYVVDQKGGGLFAIHISIIWSIDSSIGCHGDVVGRRLSDVLLLLLVVRLHFVGVVVFVACFVACRVAVCVLVGLCW